MKVKISYYIVKEIKQLFNCQKKQKNLKIFEQVSNLKIKKKINMKFQVKFFNNFLYLYYLSSKQRLSFYFQKIIKIIKKK